LLQFQKKGKSAEKALLKALSLDAENLEFLFALADHYIKRNLPDNAIAVANKMIERFPDNKIGYDILNYAKRMNISQDTDGAGDISN
jgi:predicted Zn-dependent protease